jgi:hypothetical protein
VNNKATGADSEGEAIAYHGPTPLFVAASGFSGSAANDTWRGGAIYNSTSVNLADCNFTANVARVGAAVYAAIDLHGTSTATWTLINATFFRNRADGMRNEIYFN